MHDIIRSSESSCNVITRRELLSKGSKSVAGGVLLALAGFGCNNPDVKPDEIAGKVVSTVGNVLSFFGVAATAAGSRATAIPNPYFAVGGTCLAVLGGICTVAGSGLELAAGMKSKSKPLYGIGDGVSVEYLEAIREYVRKQGWTTLPNVTPMGSKVNDLVEAFRSETPSRYKIATSPVIVAMTKKTNRPLVFQFRSGIGTDGEIKDSGSVLILGYGNKVYDCRIRVLRYLIDEDHCEWDVAADTTEFGNCPIHVRTLKSDRPLECGARRFYQTFKHPNGIDKVKPFHFVPDDDDKVGVHETHVKDDPGCKASTPADSVRC